MNTLRKWLTLITLFLCGATLLVIGLRITFSPAGFHASSGIALDSDASLISGIIAPAGTFIFASLVILTILQIASLRSQAWFIAALIYLSYGVARPIRFTIDCTAQASIFLAAAIKIFLGIMNHAMLTRSTEMQGKQQNCISARLTY